MANAAQDLSPQDLPKNLRGVDFPASKSQLVEKAKENKAEDKIMRVLDEMPERKYEDMADVMKGFGEARS